MGGGGGHAASCIGPEFSALRRDFYLQKDVKFPQKYECAVRGPWSTVYSLHHDYQGAVKFCSLVYILA